TGLVAHGRYMAGALAGSAAFLLHAPTTYPFWIVYAVLGLWPSKTRRSRLYRLWIFLRALFVLLFSSGAPSRGPPGPSFLARLDTQQEGLQRMRASYIWISIWAPLWLAHYVFLYTVTLLGVARLRNTLSPELRFFAIGLPLIGILSVPVSYLMLEKMKLAL